MEQAYYVILLVAGIENAIKCNTHDDAWELFNTLNDAGYQVAIHRISKAIAVIVS